MQQGFRDLHLLSHFGEFGMTPEIIDAGIFFMAFS